MKVLVLNSGSSSLKYRLFDMQREQAVISGHVDGIGSKDCVIKITAGSRRYEKKFFVLDHVDALMLGLKSLKDFSCIKDFSEISAVGHRVVHGGDFFQGPVLINEQVIRRIKKLCELAPLHNPSNLAGILACKKILPKAPQVACFDTAFHQTMEEENFLYGLPYEFYTKLKIRKYGFHGLSHRYVSEMAYRLLGRREGKVITCHLGNGASITAVKNGRSICTSMGFTPLEGLVMGTRSGSIDPAILVYLQAHKEHSVKKINDLLNKQSGLLGLSGISRDVRELRKLSVDGNRAARRALDVFSNRVTFYVGGYAALLGGVDAVVFTAGIGEGAWYLRKDILLCLDYLGVKLDPKANRKGDVIISSSDSKVKVYVIPTNEEIEIARETVSVVRR
jgi:acetate kinase